MTYVRIDTETSYIYFANDTQLVYHYLDSGGKSCEKIITRSQYTLNTNFECIRMTRKNNIPIDKTTGVWYNKSTKGRGN